MADHCSESCRIASLSCGVDVGSSDRIGIGFGTRLAKQGLLYPSLALKASGQLSV